MKFDSNLAWRQASAAVTANRDVLLALAGVFFLLPRLAMALFLPDAPVPQGNDPMVMARTMEEFYRQLLPWLVPMALLQGVGTLAILTLFTDRSRPTVGEAIKLGARGLLPYLLAQVLFALGMGLAGGGLVMLASLSGSAALATTVGAGVIVAALVAYVHLVLVGPVVAVERVYNPVAAMRRSWDLMRGNALRVLGFLLLISMVAVVGMLATTSVAGAMAALVSKAETVRVCDAVISGLLGAVITLYMVSVLAAIHRQLAGPGAPDTALPFE